jgi:hypothetical protein
MSKDKDAADLSAERLAELIREYGHSPMLFSAKASEQILLALRELQRLRSQCAGGQWQPIAGEAQRYALDKELCGLVHDATGNWIQITDYWTVYDELQRLRAASAPSEREQETVRQLAEMTARAVNSERKLRAASAGSAEDVRHPMYLARQNMERACSWFQIQEVAHRGNGDISWESMQRWLAAPTSQPAEEARCGTCDNLGAIKDPEKDLQIYGSDDYVPCPDCRPAEAPATAPQSAGDVLLPCPFCGGKAEHDTDDLGCHGIRCMDCTIYLGAYSTKNRAAQVWNKRPSTAAAISEGEREALERAAKAVEHCATLPDTTVGGARLAETDAAFLRSLVARLSLDKEPTKNKS